MIVETEKRIWSTETALAAAQKEFDETYNLVKSPLIDKLLLLDRQVHGLLIALGGLPGPSPSPKSNVQSDILTRLLGRKLLRLTINSTKIMQIRSQVLNEELISKNMTTIVEMENSGLVYMLLNDRIQG